MGPLLHDNEGMETEELIQRVKANDSDACKEMIDGFKRMIHSIINDYDLECGDFTVSRDDLFQEACIGIYEACFAYRSENNTKFSTLVYLIVKRRINRFYKNHIKRYVNESYSLDNMELLDHREEVKSNCVSEDPVAYHRNREAHKIIGSLSDFDREILLLRMKNYSYAEIAEKMNTTAKKVDNRLYKLRKKYLRYRT